MIKKISPQAIVALEKALSVIYWYKDDLKRYLYQAIDHAEILSVINWSEPKRNIVARVISMLEKNGEKTYDTLLQEEFYKLKYCSTVVYMVPRA